MIIVINKRAFDPYSGVAAPTDLGDGLYPGLKLVKREIVPPIGRTPFRDDLCNPEPHSVRGFNTIGNY